MTNIFITGGSRGIGARIVRTLSLNPDFRVGFIYKNDATSAKDLTKSHNCLSFQSDVGVFSEIDTAIRAFGDVDVLICNAGISHFSLFQDTSFEDWQVIFQTNFFGVVNAIRAVIPSMINKKIGKIITISSIFGLDGASCESAYSSSKGALIALSKSLAQELSPSGIWVGCIAPGFVDTEMNAHLTAAERGEFLKNTPSGRAITTNQIADFIHAIINDNDGKYQSGQVFRIE